MRALRVYESFSSMWFHMPDDTRKLDTEDQAPTVVLASIALVAGPKFFPRLEKAIPRLQYEAKVTLLWIAAIVGIYMVIYSLGALR